jgi:hypothetical protein
MMGNDTIAYQGWGCHSWKQSLLMQLEAAEHSSTQLAIDALSA